MIPVFIWFAFHAAALAGCLLWHKRCPSPHLATAAAGLALLLLLTLPSLFEEVFGWDALEQFASSFIEPEADSAYWQGRSPGQLLLQRCQQFEWIGMAFFALGITRFSRQLSPSHPPLS